MCYLTIKVGILRILAFEKINTTLKFLLFTSILLCMVQISWCQKLVTMRNLWVKPEVHITFGDYNLAFTVHDINKSLKFLHEEGSIWGDSTYRLDTGKQYYAEIMAGLKMEYQFTVQAVLQNAVGAYLLSIGKAEVKDKKGAILKSIVADITYAENGEDAHFASFYSPKSNQLLFQGRLPATLRNRDIGIDD